MPKTFLLRINEKCFWFYRIANIRLSTQNHFQWNNTLFSSISRGIYPKIEVGQSIEQIDRELSDSKYQLQSLTGMLDRRYVERHYNLALKGLCGGGLLGLSLMMVASMVTAFLLTILVCVDSHTWIYLSNRFGVISLKKNVRIFLTTKLTYLGDHTVTNLKQHHFWIRLHRPLHLLGRYWAEIQLLIEHYYIISKIKAVRWQCLTLVEMERRNYEGWHIMANHRHLIIILWCMIRGMAFYFFIFF